MDLFRSFKLYSKGKSRADPPPPDPSAPPPDWSAAQEIVHSQGLRGEATEDSYQSAELFCSTYPLEPPRLLPSHIVDRIAQVGCLAWGISYPQVPHTSITHPFPGILPPHHFSGSITNPPSADLSSCTTYFNPETKHHSPSKIVRISTSPNCKDTSLLSTLPLLAGHYSLHGKQGIYYELLISSSSPSTTIALGTACRPYPPYRLPGWNRLSAALHLDDFRKFFEDPDGGRDYLPSGGEPGAYLPERIQAGSSRPSPSRPALAL